MSARLIQAFEVTAVSGMGIGVVATGSVNEPATHSPVWLPALEPICKDALIFSSHSFRYFTHIIPSALEAPPPVLPQEDRTMLDALDLQSHRKTSNRSPTIESSGFSRARLSRLHDTLKRHVEIGQNTRLRALVRHPGR